YHRFYVARACNGSLSSQGFSTTITHTKLNSLDPSNHPEFGALPFFDNFLAIDASENFTNTMYVAEEVARHLNRPSIILRSCSSSYVSTFHALPKLHAQGQLVMQDSLQKELVPDLYPLRNRCKHLVLVASPFQVHMTPMLQLATVLHSKGFSITIAHTKLNSLDLSKHPEFGVFPLFDNFLAIDALANFTKFLQDLLTQKIKEKITIIHDNTMYVAEEVARNLNHPSIVLRSCSSLNVSAFHTLPKLHAQGQLPVQVVLVQYGLLFALYNLYHRFYVTRACTGSLSSQVQKSTGSCTGTFYTHQAIWEMIETDNITITYDNTMYVAEEVARNLNRLSIVLRSFSSSYVPAFHAPPKLHVQGQLLMQDSIWQELVPDLYPLSYKVPMTPMLQLAIVLHSKGFSITIAHTKLNSLDPSKNPEFGNITITYDNTMYVAEEVARNLNRPSIVLRSFSSSYVPAFHATPKLHVQGQLLMQDSTWQELVPDLYPLRYKDLPNLIPDLLNSSGNIGDDKNRCKHLVLVARLFQVHMTPTIQLANVLHSKGFSITIAHTKLNSLDPSNHPEFGPLMHWQTSQFPNENCILKLQDLLTQKIIQINDLKITIIHDNTIYHKKLQEILISQASFYKVVVLRMCRLSMLFQNFMRKDNFGCKILCGKSSYRIFILSCTKIYRIFLCSSGNMRDDRNRYKHLVLLSSPFQVHMTPMLQLATVLHSKGFSITIAHTKLNSLDPSKHPEFGVFPLFNNFLAIDALANFTNENYRLQLKDLLTQKIKQNITIIHDNAIRSCKKFESPKHRFTNYSYVPAFHALPKLYAQGQLPVQGNMGDDRNRKHLVLVASPFQFHITPMLQLATVLHSKGFSITIAHTKLNSLDPSNHPKFGVFPLFENFLATDASANFTNSSYVPAFHALPKLHAQGQLPVQDSMSQELVPDLYPLSPFQVPMTPMLQLATVLHSKRFSVTIAHTKLNSLEPSNHPEFGGFPLFDNFLAIDASANFTKFLQDLLTQNIKQKKLQEIRIAQASFYEQHYLIPIFAISPLNEMTQFPSMSFLEEDTNCILWLDKQAPRSVIYVSFGILATMDEKELVVTAWGLANCKQPFLWVGSVKGSDWIVFLPEGFMEEVGGRGLVLKLVPQKHVLSLSALESLFLELEFGEYFLRGSNDISGIFRDQCVNSRYLSLVWQVGLELEYLERWVIASVVRRLLVDDEGMRKIANNMKEKAKYSLSKGGSSFNSLNCL
ncbi:LOW QUALITY PROTEIN: hypothetical protein M8C21_030973, partial [Ambrosia artemisiifolia]